jgi:hypothetical protein
MGKVVMVMFEVTGTGEFPLDMLRYDGCYPVRQPDVSQIEATFRRGNHVSRTVRLARRVDAAHRTDPTVARWWSFGWRGIEVRKVAL